MKLWSAVLIFATGLGIGLSAQTLMPELLIPYLPQSLQVHQVTVDGQVIRKHREEAKLLLTVSTPQGALLATFTDHVPEIDLLVEEGDTVTLGLSRYEPFVTNPRVKGVMKPDVAPQTMSGSPASHETLDPPSESSTPNASS
ncbi:MAG: hypothetical protein D6704_13050 [Nitrospirae bacterium]|nr:MAG: hypothetical protein D6704_13050 [Nitrospirota bacterium]